MAFPVERFPAGTGHFHSRGKKFVIYRYDGDVKGEKVYEDQRPGPTPLQDLR